MISAYPDLPTRKEFLLSYCQGITKDIASNERLIDKLDALEPLAFVVSFFFLSAAIIERMVRRDSEPTYFIVAIVIHLVMLSFIIFVRVLLIYSMGMLL